MKKKTKWALIALISICIAGLAINAFLPHQNEELTEAPAKASSSSKNRSLNVIGEII